MVTHLLPQPASASCAAAIAAAAIAARHQPRSRTWQRFLVGSNILDYRLSSRVTPPRPPHAPVIVPLLVVSNYIGHELAPPLQLIYRIEPPHAEVDHRWYRHQCLLQSRRTTHQHFQRLQPARGRNNINLRDFLGPQHGRLQGPSNTYPKLRAAGEEAGHLGKGRRVARDRGEFIRRWKRHVQSGETQLSTQHCHNTARKKHGSDRCPARRQASHHWRLPRGQARRPWALGRTPDKRGVSRKVLCTQPLGSRSRGGLLPNFRLIFGSI